MSDTDLVSLTEDFFDLERDLDLLNKTIDGTYFWERIRFPIHKDLRLRVVGQGATGEDVSDNYLSGARLLLRNLFMKNPIFSQETELLFYATGRRQQFDDGLWWDIYHDTVIELLHEDCLLWERPYEVSHLTPAKTENLRYVDLVEYTGTLMRKAGLRTVSFSEEDRTLLDQIETELTTRFGVEFPLQSMVKDDLSKRKARLPLYRRLLRKVDPNVAFLTVSYFGRETFVESCQREGIPVVELQHGVYSRYHLGYSFPYEKKHVFPDYFFSFGDYWSDSIDLPISADNVYSVGYPYLEQESMQYEDVQDKNQTVIVSQPTIGEELSQFAVELSRRSEFQNDIVYKIHPKVYDSWEEKYPRLAASSVTCITDEQPLYRLFAESTTQIGVYSTALYEGLLFDVNTYIVELPGYEYVQYLIDNGYVKSVRTVDEFLTERSDSQGSAEVDRGYFFEPNPTARIRAAIDEISH